MTLYFISQGEIELSYVGGGQLWPIPVINCDTTTLAGLAQSGTYIGFSTAGIISISASNASGSFEEHLEPMQNPWSLVVVAPTSAINPTLTLTYGPIMSEFEVTTMILLPSSFTPMTVTTTLAFLTTVEVPFTQTYGSWIVAVILAVVISVGMWAVSGRKRKT